MSLQMSMETRTAMRPDVDVFLTEAATRAGDPATEWTGPLRCGIDLGTATVVLTVVDADDRPVHLDAVRESAVRDGVVVDFHAAVQAVRGLRVRAQEALQVDLDAAAAAFPPGVSLADARACRFVLENAGLECRELVDEVGAAQALLRIEDGVIADVGGGSTGVGCYRGGELISLGDLPGGGHHLNLILAGALGLGVEEAEARKRRDGAGAAAHLKPGIERIAHNIGRLMPADPAARARLGPVHLVGGALMVPGAARVVQSYLGHAVVEHPHALLVTPFGIALS